MLRQGGGNILVSKKDKPDSPLVMTRVEGLIQASALRVLDFISSLRMALLSPWLWARTCHRPTKCVMSFTCTEYDPLVMSCRTIKQVSPHVDIAHLCARSPFPFIADRDFVLLRSIHVDHESGAALSHLRDGCVCPLLSAVSCLSAQTPMLPVPPPLLLRRPLFCNNCTVMP